MSAPLLAESRTAAVNALSISDSATPEQARLAFLNRLENTDYYAVPIQVEAAAALGAIVRKSPRPALDRETERILAGKVEEFADSYWCLTPPDRRDRWQMLKVSCEAFPRLVGRLCDLDKGLDIVVPATVAEPRDRALAAAIAELYPLKPATRAARRTHLLNEAGSPEEVQSAARSLWQSASPMGQIDHGLINTLVDKEGTVPILRKTWSDTESEESGKPTPDKNYWWLVAIPIVIIGVFGGIAKQSATKDTPSSLTRPTFDPNRYFSKDSGDPGGEAIQRLMGSKRIIYQLRPLTPRQRETLKKLITLDSISKERYVSLAKEFLDERDLPVPSAENEKAASEWEQYCRKEMSDQQREIVSRLTKGLATVEEIARVFESVVAAGKGRKQPTSASAEKKP